jgi:hypothetical protein
MGWIIVDELLCKFQLKVVTDQLHARQTLKPTGANNYNKR